jgi:hypothetical protein
MMAEAIPTALQKSASIWPSCCKSKSSVNGTSTLLAVAGHLPARLFFAGDFFACLVDFTAVPHILSDSLIQPP